MNLYGFKHCSKRLIKSKKLRTKNELTLHPNKITTGTNM